ncbi:hypothetical protein GT030_30770, partial [Streptomyces sp. SID1328]|uniref:condensation domain-containing protein n=1 Tax=Streptomyces sp. SID1328 TaxID=2690250 RepID=UPI0013938B54
MRENRSAAFSVTPEESFELTAAQQGVWYGQLVDPDSPKYNIGECLEIRGGLDEDLFAAAVDRAVYLHDSFHLQFVTDGETIRQRVVRSGPDAPSRLHRVDLSGEEAPTAAAERYMADDMATVDRLDSPRHHFALLRLSPTLHFWYIRYHHIAVDGLSGALFARTVADLYTRAVRGENTDDITAAPLRDLVDEEAAYRASGRTEADRAYWTGRFTTPAGDASDDGTRA